MSLLYSVCSSFPSSAEFPLICLRVSQTAHFLCPFIDFITKFDKLPDTVLLVPVMVLLRLDYYNSLPVGVLS